MHTRTALRLGSGQALLALRHFAHEHDDLPAFHAGYLVLTVIIAGLFNLGVFVLIIVAHMALDLVKYREVHGFSWTRTVEGTLRESLLDFFLLASALALSVYLHHAAGIIAVSGIVRADLSIARLTGVFLPKFEILHRFLPILLRTGEHLRTIPFRIGQRLTAGEKMEVFLFVASFTLLLLAPLILRLSAADLGTLLARELIPWRM
jgi:hypothetical protein